MKKLYIVANWKANKNEGESIMWLEGFYAGEEKIENRESKEIIICPPFTVLLQLKKYIDANGLNLKLGSQDISKFGKGAYTGEIPAEIIKGVVTHAIIGHSERRQNFNETNEDLEKKVANSISSGISPIYCVQDEATAIPASVEMVAYEPISAIGTGNPDTPENAEKVASTIKSKNANIKFVLYGGSVTAENVASFTNMASIDGVLIGGASLEPSSFLELVKQC